MIVEVGPHSQLKGPVNQILKALQGEKQQTTYTSTIKRGKNTEATLLEYLGSVHVRAAALLLNEVNEFNKNNPPSLLRYACAQDPRDIKPASLLRQQSQVLHRHVFCHRASWQRRAVKLCRWMYLPGCPSTMPHGGRDASILHQYRPYDRGWLRERES